MNIRNMSVCTAGLALALSLQPGYVHAASHCKGLENLVCGTTAACKWNDERQPAFGVSKRKAHCRLDVKAAGKLASEIASKGK